MRTFFPALAFALPAVFGGLLASPPAHAQLPLEADNTLGGESSVVIPADGFPGFFIVGGGAVRGENLFHSFEEFNVNEGGGVLFFDPEAIDNVITRVTGDNPSNILGALGMLNDANLFLLNPNGIIFGEGAQLFIQGSFLATTADSFLFPDAPAFSAANPDPNALLSINVPIGLQFGSQPAPITSEAILAMPTDSRLILAGGPLVLDNSTLLLQIPETQDVSSGRIALAAIGGEGTVDLSTDEVGLALNLPNTLQRADITLSGTFLSIFGNGGGEISLFGEDVRFQDGSIISFAIGDGLGRTDSQLGNVRLDATGRVVLTGGSSIGNSVFAGGTGMGGTIQIDAADMEVRQGSRVSTSTGGRGNAGNIAIRVRDRLLLTGSRPDGAPSLISSQALPSAEGNTGAIAIEATDLEVRDGSSVETITATQGNAGEIRIQTGDRLLISGVSAEGRISSVSTTVLADAIGTGGNIFVETQSLELRHGATLSSLSAGEGNTGNIRVRAGDRILITGTSEDGTSLSSLVSSMIAGSVGQGGTIRVETAVLEVRDRASINVLTNGTGDAGTLRLRASDRIRLSDNGTSILSSVGNQANGNGGSIEIRTPNLDVLNGSQVNASTFGRGNAGRIVIRTRDRLLLAGNGADPELGSIITSGVSSLGEGNGGSVRINTGVLEVRDGATIGTDTFNRGRAGRIVVRAGDRILLTGRTPAGNLSSRIGSTVQTNGRGSGGSVALTTPILAVQDGAQILASTFGRGDAGNVVINASDRVLFARGAPDGDLATGAFSSAGQAAIGDGGNVEINTARLEVRRGAQIGADTFSTGDAGNVVINASDRARFIGRSANGASNSAALSGVERTASGRGGRVEINTPLLEVRNGARLGASTSGQGDAGNVVIRASDRARFSQGGNAQSGVRAGAVGNGGNVEVETPNLQLLDGGQLFTSTQGEGNAGNVVVRVGDRLTIAGRRPGNPDVRSGILSRVVAGAVGDGGTIDVQAGAIDLDDGVLSALSQGEGTGGNIFVTANTLQLENQSRIDTETLSTDGGNVILTIEDLLLLRDNSLISTSAGTAQSGGDGGDITLDNPDGFVVAVPDEDSDIVANAFEGRGGNIRITTQGIFGLEFRDARTPFSDITASSEVGIDGEVEIITPNVDPTQGLVALPTDVVDAADQIGQVCPTGPGAAEQLGRFVITERGGVTTSPLDVLSTSDIEVDWLEDSDNLPAETAPPLLPQSQQTPPPLVEANGWLRSGDGRVHLVATVPNSEGAIAPPPQSCP